MRQPLSFFSLRVLRTLARPLIVSDHSDCPLVFPTRDGLAGSAAVGIMLLSSLLVFATAAMSQRNTYSADASSATQISRLCNSSISDANASAIITHDPATDWQTGGRSGTPEHTWAVTITGGNGQKIERQFWYDTAGVDYADDVGMDQDVCAFPNFYLPLNAHRLGRDDPGNCSTVFTQRCIDSVTSAASESALKWTTYSSPPPYENLTAGVLPSICTYIAKDLQDAIEKDCGPQMQAEGNSEANFQNPRGK